MSVWTREKADAELFRSLAKPSEVRYTTQTITIFQVVDVIFSVELTISFEWASKMN